MVLHSAPALLFIVLIGDSYSTVEKYNIVNQKILAAIKFGVSQNKVIGRLLNLARQILAKTRNSPNIIAPQNLLIYSNQNTTLQQNKANGLNLQDCNSTMHSKRSDSTYSPS